MPGISNAVKAQPRIAVGQGRPAGPGAPAIGQARPASGGGGAPVKDSPYAKSLQQPAATMPWDSAYEGSVAGARAKYNNALIGANANRLSTEQEYGFDPGFNDFASNSYSRAAALERSYQTANRASKTSLGSAGHLYSGALQNQLGYNRFSHDEEESGLRTSYQEALANIQAKEREAEDELHGAEADAAWKRVEAAERQPLDTSTVSDGGGGGGSGPGSYAKTKKGTKYGVAKGRRAR